MDTKPPILTSAPKPPKTFYHQAATYCLLAPFVATGVTIMTNVGSSSPTTRLELLVSALFQMIIILSGVVFGIISLFGIRRYGKAGILWKAVAGILIVVLFALAAIPNFLYAREKARERHEQMYGHPAP
jgi:hypothetical protein